MADVIIFNGFASRLREARRERGFSQDALGVAIRRTGAAVSSWERGKNTPEPAIWGALARELKVLEQWLLYGSGPKYPDAEQGEPMTADKALLIKKIRERRLSPAAISALDQVLEATTPKDEVDPLSPSKRA
jgi:ribosome-binding protein aMBF1 (putative translation factor)